MTAGVAGMAGTGPTTAGTPVVAPRASVVVLSWNTQAMTLHCLRSLEASLDAFPSEVVVVDNGSTDGSGDAVADGHPGALLLRSDRNLGFAAGVNAGLELATAPYVVLLNSDTTVLPGAVQELVEYLDLHPDVGAVGGRRFSPDGEEAVGGHRFPCLVHDFAAVPLARRAGRTFRRRFPWAASKLYATTTREVDWVTGAFVAVRREAIAAAGPMPEEFFVYGEDVEWFWRMRASGWKVAYLRGAGVIHREGTSAEQLFGSDRPMRILDGLHVFATRHRHPAVWRIGWSVRAASMMALAARRLVPPVDDQARAEARTLVRYARRHVAQVFGVSRPADDPGARSRPAATAGTAGPTVTIYIASLNTAAATELCVRSGRRLAGYPAALTVGDSGSTDGSLRALRRFAADGWLTLEVAPEGRYHAAWLDHWLANCRTDYAVFVDSDVEFRREGWLRDLVDAATPDTVALVAAEMISPVEHFQAPRSGAGMTEADRRRMVDELFGGCEVVRLAARPAPWLLLVKVASVAALGASFQLQHELDDRLPEGSVFYDVGAALYRQVLEAGLECATMPASFLDAYHHFGGLSWIPMKGRRGLKKARDLATVRTRLARARWLT